MFAAINAFLTRAVTNLTDVYWPFVSTLLHGDGVNGGQNNTFLDGSTNNFTLTRYGNTTQGSFNPFVKTYPYAVATNGGSAYFDGTGDYLTIPSTTAFTVPASGSFTIEAWVNLSSLGADRVVFASGIGNGLSDLYFGITSSNTIDFIAPSTSGATGYYAYGTTALAANTWYHIAATRVGGTVRLFLNGTQETITQYQPGNSANQFGTTGLGYVGSYFGSSSFFFGYISNLRFVNGTALYTASFTPPTAPLTAITNTSLLLGFTNGAIYDNTMLNNLETVSSAQISTSVFKYGTGSVRTGSGNYLSTPIKEQFQLTGDFTVETWAYVVNNVSSAVLLDCSAGGGINGWFLEYSNARGLFFAIGSASLAYATTPALSTWTYLAVSRQSGTLRFFINGTLVASGSAASYATATLPLLVGAANSYTTTYYFDGYLDDIRVTKNIARYTATFTPPTAAFPNLGPTYPSGTATQRAIFGFGYTNLTMTNIVSNTGVVAAETTGVGTGRSELAASGYGCDKAIFGFGSVAGTFYSITNLVSNTGVMATDTAGVGQARLGSAAAKYGTDKAIFAYGGRNYPATALYLVSNLVSNTGVVATDTSITGTARLYLAAAGYGNDKAIFGYGSTIAGTTYYSMTNLVSNTGVVATDTTGVGTGRYYLAASGYGTDKSIFGYGTTASLLSMTNLVSNVGVVATDTTGVGTGRSALAASGYGSDKAIFGYGYTGVDVSMTNLVSNTGVVATDTTGVGTARSALAAAGFSYS